MRFFFILMKKDAIPFNHPSRGKKMRFSFYLPSYLKKMRFSFFVYVKKDALRFFHCLNWPPMPASASPQSGSNEWEEDVKRVVGRSRRNMSTRIAVMHWLA